MFKVDQDAIGRYRISIGVGKIYSTRDIEEVKGALDHYYGDTCRLGNNSNYILCRAINEEAAQMRKK